MTGRRRTRTTSPTPPRPRKAKLLYASALLACASVAVGCGVIPGATGGSGDGPVKVMTWAPEKTNATNKPGMPALARAYARWVNAHGGINGRRLQVLTCNDHNDSVAAAHCAERAVDEDVVAVVGSYSQHSRAFLAPLESAGIPYIGGFGVTDDEFTSPVSYPVNGGQGVLLAGLGEQLGKNCGPVSLIRPDTIAGDELPVLLDSGLKALGHSRAADQRAAEDATEYSRPTRQALEHATSDPSRPGCVVPALGDRTNTFMDSFRRDAEDFPKVHTGTVIGNVDQSLIDATGGKSGPYEGSYVTGWYPTADDSRWNPMRAVIKEQAFGDNRIDPADAGVQTTWIAYTVLKKAIESLGAGEVSPLTLRRELDNGLKVDTGGLTPELSWRFDADAAAADFPRLVNANVTFQAVSGGLLTSQRKGFVDMTKTLDGETD
ncbi:ABC transporter substrate-binding protein [Streptomyces sp. NPDC127077]|uniref:ABC transporter substrate-binding protein n=1 Tax=Streptomyces sp. NPDC127077 TaxID=3347131 RepID=UPI00364D3A4A